MAILFLNLSFGRHDFDQAPDVTTVKLLLSARRNSNRCLICYSTYIRDSKIRVQCSSAGQKKKKERMSPTV